MRQRVFDMVFKDDRMVVLEVAPDTADRFSGDGVRPLQWAVITRRNVPGYPVQAVVSFPTRAEALAHYHQAVVQTPRLSLGGRAPHPVPSVDEYIGWLDHNELFDPVLNPDGALRFDSSHPLNRPPMPAPR
jgi:hypothetical protein